MTTAAAAGDHEPAVERDEVHFGQTVASSYRCRFAGPRPLSNCGYGSRHRRAIPAARVRSLRAGRQHDLSFGRRTWTRACIVRHLVEAHQRSVAADSAGPGQGSTFRVSLPLASATEAVSAVGEGPDRGAYRADQDQGAGGGRRLRHARPAATVADGMRRHRADSIVNRRGSEQLFDVPSRTCSSPTSACPARMAMHCWSACAR